MTAAAAAILWLAAASPAAVARPQDKGAKAQAVQPKPDPDLQILVKLADEAMSGQSTPSDFPLQFQNDFLKAQDNRTYVPFTVSFDASKLASSSVNLYVRVATRGSGVVAPPEKTDKKDDRKKDKKDKKDTKDAPPPPAYAFEDVHAVDVAPAAGQHARITRAFAVPAGDYDVYFVLRERNVGAGTTPKTAVLKQPLSVPDFWTNELTTSTVMLADRVDTLSAPLTKDQQVEHPYALGSSDIQISADSTFRKTEELSVVFLIYNPAVTTDKDSGAKKFDLQVDYSFYRRTPDGEKYFNRTEPQRFNPGVLGPQFDLSAGHQLVAGQAVPLSGFQEGDYRLEIKVTDLVSNKTLTREVSFTVTS